MAEIRLLDYDELNHEQRLQSFVLGGIAFGGNLDEEAVERLRSTGRFADYFGIHAVEGGEVIGRVFVFRLDYAFPAGGTVKITGISGVTTRPDRSRRGVARMIMDEIHRREREQGISHSVLWTSPSWHAHELYLDLGYRDVYNIPFAFRGMAAASPRPPGLEFAPALISDSAEIGRMHRKAARGGVGFVGRPDSMIEARAGIGSVKMENLKLVKAEGETVGYAYCELDRLNVTCREAVSLREELLPDIVRLVESMAPPGGMVIFPDSVENRTAGVFSSLGYTIYPSTWRVLMGMAYGRMMTESAAVEEFGTSRSNFFCQAGDHF